MNREELNMAIEQTINDVYMKVSGRLLGQLIYMKSKRTWVIAALANWKNGVMIVKNRRDRLSPLQDKIQLDIQKALLSGAGLLWK